MDIQQIIATLDSLQDIEDERQLDEMVEAVSQLNKSPQSEAAESLFRIFERFPEDDGYETFWSILHALEKTPNYELELVKSITRQPSKFNILVINRMLNGGIHHIGDTNLVDILQCVLNDERTPSTVKHHAAELIQRHET